MSTIVFTDQAPAAIGPYSQAVKIGDLVFTSGQIPCDPGSGNVVEGGIVAQTAQVMKNLTAVLDAAGSSMERAIKTTCYLKSMEDFSVFNQIYAEYFVNKPARSCVAVRELPKGVLVEVEVIAQLVD